MQKQNFSIFISVVFPQVIILKLTLFGQTHLSTNSNTQINSTQVLLTNVLFNLFNNNRNHWLNF